MTNGVLNFDEAIQQGRITFEVGGNTFVPDPATLVQTGDVICGSGTVNDDGLCCKSHVRKPQHSVYTARKCHTVVDSYVLSILVANYEQDSHEVQRKQGNDNGIA